MTEAEVEGFRLTALSPDAPPEIRLEEGIPAPPIATAKPANGAPRTFWIGAVTFLAAAGSAANSFIAGPHEPFHFDDEGWFGQDTYAGGADKASHFVSYFGAAQVLTEVYGGLGMNAESAPLLGAAASAFAGLVTEFGDGTTWYGFSWSDVAADALGAASSLAVYHFGLRDLIGFRAGVVPAPDYVCCPYGGFGKDYTPEIYTADLKIAGLAKRLGFSPGPARFLLLSTTYSTKGYPFADPVIRERQVGIEVGLNMREIFHAVGIPDDRWWGRFVLTLSELIRIPYTSVGFYYDLNHDRWYGPSNGGSWSQTP